MAATSAFVADSPDDAKSDAMTDAEAKYHPQVGVELLVEKFLATGKHTNADGQRSDISITRGSAHEYLLMHVFHIFDKEK